jgi:alanyl-tRNA synthetase
MLVTATRERLGNDPAVIALAAVVAEKPVVIVATNQAARDAGHRAGSLAKQVAGILGGGGGGKDDLAQGGGTNVTAIPAALTAVRTSVAG